MLGIRSLLNTVSSLGGCGNIHYSGGCFVCWTHLPDRFLICIETCCCQNYFLGHRYKACHHLRHQDVPMDASALQNVQGVYQAEDAQAQVSDLEAGQADVPQASTFSVRGDRAIVTLMGIRMGWRAIPDFQAQDVITLCSRRPKETLPTREKAYVSSSSAWPSDAQKTCECNVLCAKLLLPSLIRRATRCADFKTGCQMLHKALLDCQQTIGQIAQLKQLAEVRPLCRSIAKRT